MLKFGADGVKKMYAGEVPIKTAYAGAALVFDGGTPSRLPEGYTEVEYIECTDNKFSISAGIVGGGTYSLELEVYITDPGLSGSHYIITTNSTVREKFSVYNTTQSRLFYLVRSGGYTDSGITTYKKKVSIVYSATDNALYLNGKKMNNSTLSEPVHPRLGSYDQSYSAEMRIHSCKSYHTTGVVMCDLVPCINPEKVVGLYDIEHGKFYQNLKTGNVIPGPAV